MVKTHAGNPGRPSAQRRMSVRCRAFPFMPSANSPTPARPCSAPAPTAASPRPISTSSSAASPRRSSTSHGQVTPNLLIVETRLAGPGRRCDELDRLAEVCDPTTKVVVVGRVNDVELYRELMRRGASEYLVAPLDPLHLIEVISGLYTRSGRAARSAASSPSSARAAAPAPRRSATMSAGASPKNSTSTRRSSISICRSARSASISTTKPGQGVADALTAPERLDDVLLDRLLVKRGDHLSLFTAPAVAGARLRRRPDAYEAVLDAVRQTTPCVIVDLPHSWDALGQGDADRRRRHRDRGDARSRLAAQRQEHRRAAAPAAGPTTRAPKLVLEPDRPAQASGDSGQGFRRNHRRRAGRSCWPSIPLLFGQAANNGQMLGEAGPEIADAGRHAPPGRPAHRPQAGAARSSSARFLSLLKGKKRA